MHGLQSHIDRCILVEHEYFFDLTGYLFVLRLIMYDKVVGSLFLALQNSRLDDFLIIFNIRKSGCDIYDAIEVTDEFLLEFSEVILVF